jgi:acetyl esterase/lipase
MRRFSMQPSNQPNSYVRFWCTSLLLVTFLLGSGVADAQDLFRDPQFEVQVTRNIVYGTATTLVHGSPTEILLKLDVYQPTGPNVPDSLPGILIIHGGGFGLLGGKDWPSHWWQARMPPLMAARGYVAVSIDYRVYNKHLLNHLRPVVSGEYQEFLADLMAFCCPVCVCQETPEYVNTVVAATEDAAAALRWLVANAETLRLDPSRIVVSGSSAGGFMTRWLTYHLDDHGIDDLPAIAAAVTHTGAGGDHFLEDVVAGAPPLLMQCNEDDPLHSFEAHVLFASHLESERIPFEFHHKPGGNEVFTFFDDEIAPGVTVFDRAVEFLHFHLFVSPDIDINPWRDTNSINPFSRGVTSVAILGSDTFDVADVDVTTLAFGPNGAPPAFDLTNPWVYWLAHWDVNRDGEKDLLSYYRIPETGIALGDTEACLSGETLDGMSFQDCNVITTLAGCGHGFELAFLVPPLIWMRQRRKRRTT